MTEKIKGRVRVLACGGCGINIARVLEQFRNSNDVGIAKIEVSYIDTSRSNLGGAEFPIPEEAIYLVDGLDGSGKIRRENAGEITARVRDILQHHKPLDLTIVISSASGGSGSVIAPSLVNELLSRDAPVVVIAVGSTDTRLDIDNTIKTIKSYAQISNQNDKPISIAYFQNSSDTPRGKVDSQAGRVILALASVFSREHHELDTKDLFNFLRYDRATTFTAQLSGLEVFYSELPADLVDRAISMATVTTADDVGALSFTPDYWCKGYLPGDVAKSIAEIAPIHVVTTANLFQPVIKSLNANLDQLAVAQRARVAPEKILTDNDKPNDNGLIL